MPDSGSPTPEPRRWLSALLIFRLLPTGFTNRDLRDLVGQLLDHTMSAGQLTYDPRRLRAHGLLTRLPHSHRYHVTDTGLTTPSSSPAPTTGCYAPVWPNSPTPAPRPLQTASRAHQHATDTIAKNPDSQPET